ncbi:chemotaxis protein CheA [Hydrogenophaga sp. 5NK40-0174]|uniref:chemotaxis protein CheA n=1 Tax=Hydrogenophaga sp. 5NK40-0174 TaxID=3127649 RepID=UPI0031056DA8
MSQEDADRSFILEALPAFISEAGEQLESIEQLLLELEDDPKNSDLLGALFRCAHTVKGSAGIFGLDEVVAFTHHVETLLDRLRDGLVSLSPDMSTLLLQCNDQIRALIDQAQSGKGPSDDAHAHRTKLEQSLMRFSGDQGGGADAGTDEGQEASAATTAEAVTEGHGRWHIDVRFHADTFRNGMDPMAILNYVRGLGIVSNMVCRVDDVPALEPMDPESCHLGFQFDLDTDADQAAIESAFTFVQEDCTLEIQPPQKSSAPAATANAEPSASAAASAAEISGGATKAATAVKGESKANPPAQATAARGDAKASSPAVGEQRFIRVQADRLDDVINLLGELVIAGAGAQMLARQSGMGTLVEANDQINSLIEEIRNGTLQLRMVPIGETFSRFRRVVRDTAAELGKDVQLEIVGGDTELDKSVVERIADPLMHLVRNALDHGLESPAQREAVGKPAQGKLTLSACHESGSIHIRIVDDGRGISREKVLARAWDRGIVDRNVTPADADILKLIFEPGFSTAEQVTNLSGRGVGMDVVRRNIEALRGQVQISSVEGKGSTIEIRLPLTLAIIDGFLVGVGDSRFIFPLDAVVEVIENRPTTSELDHRGRGVAELRGQVLPLVCLRSLYGLESPPPARASVVVIRSGMERYGVLVDQLMGQHQTVIKPLGRLFQSLRGVSGSSILGNGDVALICDVASLWQLTTHPPGSGATGAPPPKARAAQSKSPTIAETPTFS